MTVAMNSVNEDSFDMELPNSSFFKLLKNKEFSKVLGDPPLTNDVIIASESQALKLAALMKEDAFADWGKDSEVSGLRDMVIEFMETCGGFVTH